MTYAFPIYDVSYAVAARKYAIRNRADSDPEGKDRWADTDRFLSRLAQTRPASVQCFHSPLATTGPESIRVYLYLIYPSDPGSIRPPSEVVLYVGEALTEGLFREECAGIREFAEASGKAHELALVLQEEQTGLSRTIYGCVIACTKEPTLSRAHLQEAFRRYFARYHPLLASIPIAWLPDSAAQRLLNEINQERGRHPTR